MNVGSTMCIAQNMKRDTTEFCIISIMAIILVTSLDCMQPPGRFKCVRLFV
jgi:hypothetical protein